MNAHQRRLILATLLAALLFPIASTARPNIIIVITDDQGYPEMSAHGNPKLQTPAMDRMHREGVRLENFHVDPTCAPTRAALMSGRPAFYCGVTHTILERERMRPGVQTLPEALRDAGYATCMTGKWHLGDEKEYRPRQRGFDEVLQHGGGGIGQSFAGTCGDAPGNSYFGPWLLHNGVFKKTEGYCTDEFFNHAIQWMDKQRKTKKSFFTYISTNAPHGPLHVEKKYEQPFLDAGLNGSSAKYYGMIVNIDNNLGKLIDQLAEWEIERETLLIFMTDNGHTGAGARVYQGGMKGGKGSLDEGGSRVPCLLRWPGTLEPKAVNRLTAHIDVLPTLAELGEATLTQPDEVHGKSIVPLLKNPDAAFEDRMIAMHRGRWAIGENPDNFKNTNFAVRGERWRLVGPALYDMEADYAQTTDVAGKHPEVVAKMSAFYDQWWTGARKHMVNEDGNLDQPNPFHVMFHEQQNGPEPKIVSKDRWMANASKKAKPKKGKKSAK